MDIIKSSKTGGFGTTGVVIALVALLALAGLVYYNSKEREVALNEGGETSNQENTGNTSSGDTTSEHTGTGEEKIIKLLSQNNSGEEGVATITEVDGKAKVLLELAGAPASTPQPAHIHEKSCASIGGVKYPLTNAVNGRSETMLPVSMAELLKGVPLAINVHKSVAQAGAYVACGDMLAVGGTTVEIGTEDDMMSPPPAGSGVSTFNVSGQNFSFSVKEMRVKKGEKVRINFINSSGFHDFVVDGYNVRTKQTNTGESDSIEFIADKTGTFEYYCSIGTHRQAGMVGKLIVE